MKESLKKEFKAFITDKATIGCFVGIIIIALFGGAAYQYNNSLNTNNNADADEIADKFIGLGEASEDYQYFDTIGIDMSAYIDTDEEDSEHEHKHKNDIQYGYIAEIIYRKILIDSLQAVNIEKTQFFSDDYYPILEYRDKNLYVMYDVKNYKETNRINIEVQKDNDKDIYYVKLSNNINDDITYLTMTLNEYDKYKYYTEINKVKYSDIEKRLNEISDKENPLADDDTYIEYVINTMKEDGITYIAGHKDEEITKELVKKELFGIEE